MDGRLAELNPDDFSEVGEPKIEARSSESRENPDLGVSPKPPAQGD
jgi:hypothetical protein